MLYQYSSSCMLVLLHTLTGCLNPYWYMYTFSYTATHRHTEQVLVWAVQLLPFKLAYHSPVFRQQLATINCQLIWLGLVKRAKPTFHILVSNHSCMANFSQIGEKYNFRIENFHGLLAFAMPKDTMTQNFAEKTFANSHKTMKFTKVFSLEIFPLYSIVLWATNYWRWKLRIT